MTLARLARILRQRWRSLVGWRAADTALNDELRFHIEQLTEEKMAEGLSAEDARLAAMRAFGNTTAMADASRDARGFSWILDLSADLRYAWRVLGRAPRFSGVAIASLGLAIGGAATVAAGARAILWSAPPFPDADRLVVVRSVRRSTGPAGGHAQRLSHARRATTARPVVRRRAEPVQ